MSYDDDNIFARILRGEIPCDKVYENDRALAFRDIAPKAPTHVLVIPRGRYETLHEFAEKGSDAELADWVRAMAAVAEAEGVTDGGYRATVNNGRHGNQEVPHLHAHIVGGRQLGGAPRG